MIRSLRRRFVWGAMLSLFIVSIIFIGGLLVIGYISMERRSDAFMDTIVDNNGEFIPRLAFRTVVQGNPPADHMGYYAVSVNENGIVSDVKAMGTWEREQSEIQSLVDEIISSGNGRGRVYQFKYALRQEEGKDSLIILMDNTANARFLLDTLRIGFLIGAACMAVMFIILQPVSRRLTVPFVRNMEKQKQFITNAGHDIKTPVAIIQSNIDAMELIQGENKWSRNIRRQTLLLTELLKQLLSLARMEENISALPTELMNLERFLHNESEAYTETFKLRHLSFCIQAKDSIHIRVNRDQLSQLLHILMDNAGQYTNEHGSIILSAQKRTTKVRISLCNTVDRLPTCPPENLFDRFYRDDPSRSSADGNSGIGLSAARAIAESARWKLEAQYIDETHISFTVEIPT